MADFSLTRTDGGEHPVLQVAGDVDLAVTQQLIDEGQRGLSEPGRTALVLDLERVTFMDSSGLSALVILRNAAARVGRTVQLTNVPPNITRLLALSALDTLFAAPRHDA